MTAETDKEPPTIGDFIRTEIPDEGDTAPVQGTHGEVYHIENMGLWPPTQ